MTKEDFKEGMGVVANGRKGIGTDIELCNDGSYVVHVAFPGKETQWRVPLAEVEVAE